ncbi:flippase-like domain-containing protein [Winogradskyella sp. KYW1333]|uniref:flippase-like domain-containing protein n=1 Tax=Winogradskyella sp. KYW1333 TaxID=2282123 RepID=UPI00216226CC|nr:flippase-like domain-containing protein [Winogradskyella sp. KYW1333]
MLIKLSIVVSAGYFIYSKLLLNENLLFSTYIAFLIENDPFSLKNVLFLVFLTLFNWFFEILKWQKLVQIVQKISFKDSLEQSLGGLTASLVTPNRIGDYGAKVMYYTNRFKGKIVLLNLVGNISQMTITTVFGVIGLTIFVNFYQVDINYYRVTRFVFILLIIAILSFFGVKHRRFKVKGHSYVDLIDFIKSITINVKAKTLVFSLIRYLIFSFQFYFFLSVFGVAIDYLDAMVVITSMYFLASIIPSISIFDVVIKGSVAVFLFSFLKINELTILTIITSMWLLNFVIPSVFGGYYILNFRLPNAE